MSADLGLQANGLLPRDVIIDYATPFLGITLFFQSSRTLRLKFGLIFSHENFMIQLIPRETFLPWWTRKFA